MACVDDPFANVEHLREIDVARHAAVRAVLGVGTRFGWARRTDRDDRAGPRLDHRITVTPRIHGVVDAHDRIAAAE